MARLVITLALASFYAFSSAAMTLGGPGDESAGTAQGPAMQPRDKLLVIAPDRLHAALRDYVAHKQQRRPTALVSLEKALRESEGVDDPERLKRFLYTEWRDHQVGYALLVGDADVMPVRYMVLDRITAPAFDYAFYPSDLYYSDLAKQDGSFDDWNSSRESFHAGYFGEVRGEKNKQDPVNYDHVDYRPDLAVGRWPASTVAEVQLIAAKTIAYETGVLKQDKKGADRAAVFVVSGWVDARERMARVADQLAARWSIEKRFYAESTRDFHTPSPDETQLVKLLNEGVGLVIHAGHGTDDAWEQCFSMRSLDSVNNADRLPVMISAGCSTAICAALGPYQAYIDVNGQEHTGTDHGEVFQEPPPPPAAYQTGHFNPSGLGEQLLRRQPSGAVAYIGCNTGSQPCGLTLVDGFAQALAESSQPILGDCWMHAVSYYYERERLDQLMPTDSWYPASIFFQGMKFMVFGDPSLTLRAPDPDKAK